MPKELFCCISGSFSKHKPEIDQAIKEFNDLEVIVLEPAPGWLAKPQVLRLNPDYNPNVFRPLPNEVGLSPKQIEDRFLRALRQSNFLYLENPSGYIGPSACLEIGFALAQSKPVFARFPPDKSLDIDPFFDLRLRQIKVLSPPEVVSFFPNKIPRRGGGKTK